MYFSSRLQAGRMLASRLKPKYQYENCVVLALDEGGVMVGAQIAKELHCILNMLMSRSILLPREPDSIGVINNEGQFVYNHKYAQIELDELYSEYRSFIEQEKQSKMYDMHRVFSSGGLVSRDRIKGHNIILVSDGLDSTLPLELALEFLKPINTEGVIIATPLASVKVVDWMHLNASEIYCLSVVEDYITTSHYYDKQDIPDTKTIVSTIKNIVLNWK